MFSFQKVYIYKSDFKLINLEITSKHGIKDGVGNLRRWVDELNMYN